MQITHSFYVNFPYSTFKLKDTFGTCNDLIDDKDLNIEDIERLWGVEFFYPDGRTHSWYEANNFWSNETLFKEFCKVDGMVDLERAPVVDGCQLKNGKMYIFDCVEDTDIRSSRFSDRIIKTRVFGVTKWKTLE